jgi:hypothetical protein
MSPSAESKRSLSSSTTFEPPRCHGNACPHCGKCFDWRYDGDVDRDNERYNRGGSYEILDNKRWHRRPNGPPVTCSYFYHYHFGSIGVSYGFDMCRCA